MKVAADVWDSVQRHLDYTDEEMKIFRENPINEDVLSKRHNLMSKTIVFEVMKSEGCNSQHKVGDKFYFDGAGNLIVKLCPKNVCIFALHSLSAAIFTINELIYAGVDPNNIRFKNVGCPDVGVRCGGWGHIVMRVRVEDRIK